MAKTTTHTQWVPASHATTPAVFPPHPPLRSGGWYRATTTEVPGPGRVATSAKSARTAVGLSVLCGPLGLCYLSAGVGLGATVLSAVIVNFAGLPSLLFLWPLSVAAVLLGSRAIR